MAKKTNFLLKQKNLANRKELMNTGKQEKKHVLKLIEFQG